MEQKLLKVPENEYEDMLDYMERMRETIDVLSNQETVEKINNALERIESGDYLTKKELTS